jgi:ankyrin repeat protein
MSHTIKPARTWDDYKKTMRASIYLAAKEGDRDGLAAWLEQGLDIDARDSRGYSALMLAAYAGHEEAVRFLLDRGADANTSDHAGNSVLMGMAFKGNLRLTEMLLEAGAELDRRNAAGMNAWDFAAAFGRHEVAVLLEARRGNQWGISANDRGSGPGGIKPKQRLVALGRLIWAMTRSAVGS